jgi:hypothetical protein
MIRSGKNKKMEKNAWFSFRKELHNFGFMK